MEFNLESEFFGELCIELDERVDEQLCLRLESSGELEDIQNYQQLYQLVYELEKEFSITYECI
jgi:hypothetical protein